MLRIIEKCFAVGYVAEWGEFRPTETVYAETAGKAKMKFDNYKNEPFLKIKAIRDRENDWVEFEGKKVKRYDVVSTLQNRAYRAELQGFVARNQGKNVLIFSGQWESYWRENGQGYTKKKSEAGVYEINEAWERVSHCGFEKQILLIHIS